MTAIPRKQNAPGYIDEMGRFRPIRSPQFIGSGASKRKATVRDKKKYSKAKAGDLGKARQERALEAPWDREFRLEQEAAAADAKERARIEKEIEADVYGETSGRMSSGKAQSLAQFVRGQGGINTAARARRGRKVYGDLENFTRKGSGTSGLVTTVKGKGKGLDTMWQLARQSGFDLVSSDDLLDRLDDEIRSGKMTYATHGSLTYNPVEVILWGHRKGDPDWAEEVITTKAENHAAAKKWAKENGFDRFRVSRLDLSKPPDFGKTIRRNPAVKLVAANAADLAKARKLGRESVGLSGQAYWDNSNAFRDLRFTKTFSIAALKKLHDAFDQAAGKSSRAKLGIKRNPAGTGKKAAGRAKVNPAVAQTILQQLGGGKFVAMTGAKNLGHTANSLQFRLPANFAKDGINFVRVTLNGRDLYDVEFGKLRGVKYSVIKIDKNIYADMLADLFTRRTGLDTSLGSMGRRNPAGRLCRIYKSKGLGGWVIYLGGMPFEPDRHGVPKVYKTLTAARSRVKSLPGVREIKVVKTNPAAKENPLDLIGTFANLAVGISSAMHIDEAMKRRSRRPAAKRRGTTKAKTTARRNPARMSTVKAKGGNLYVLTIQRGDDEVGIYLHDGNANGFSKEVKTLAAARAYAKRTGRKLVENPAVKIKWVRETSKDGETIYSGLINGDYPPALTVDKAADGRWFGMHVRSGSFTDYHKTAAQAKAAVERMFKKRKTNPARSGTGKKASARSKANPAGKLPKGCTVAKDGREWVVRYPDLYGHNIIGLGKTRTAAIDDARGVLSRTKRGVVKFRKSRERLANPRPSAKTPRAARKNPPARVPARRTFEMFQGRPATTARRLAVSRHAPARLDQLGDLIEVKLNSGKVLDFSKRNFKLCAAGGKLWIAGGKIAKLNPAAAANEINPIDSIDHVVYGTRKPHHGDHEYTHYIHRLGEESGHMPTLCVDREGFPIIRGGKYKIEARGIVN